MVKKDLIYLVNAGNDPGVSSITNDNSFPPLSVLALGTWLNETIPDIRVVARDGGVFDNNKIIEEIERLKPGLVGVSVLSTSYQNSLQIAECAKDCGSQVVFGNDQAAHISRKILEKRPQVDFVIGSEYGERALELLVRHLRGEDITLAYIPDITYRQGSEIKGFDYSRDKSLLSIVNSPLYSVKSRKTALDIFPIVDRTLYPKEHWETYLKNYLDRFAGLHDDEVTGVTTMNRARGCSRNKDSTKCDFCDMLLDISFSSPEIFWKDVQVANEQVGANIFYEVCDSFSSFPKLIDEIVEARPDLDFDPKFFVYTQAIDIVRTPELVRRLKEMGVFRVNIGLESGSNQTLQYMKGKHDSVEKNYSALQMFKEAGIHVYGSFVLGSKAETQETLKETVEWAKKIMKEGLIADIEAQPLLPLPGNMPGRDLSFSRLLPQEMQDTDWPWDTDKIAEIYINNFSGISYQDAISAALEIRECAKEYRLNYGSGFIREEKYST